jgi:hypothetical protein
MPNDLTWLERLTGKRYGDIELPNESGKIDPRLKGKSVSEALAKAKKGYDKLRDNPALKGLYDAAGKKR